MGHASFKDFLASKFSITEEVLTEALDRQQKNSRVLVGQVLLENEMVTQRDLDKVLEIQIREVSQAVVSRPRRIGELLIEYELLSEEQLQRALAIQNRRRRMQLGDVLVEMGILSKEKFEEAKTQWNRDHVTSAA